MKDNLGDSYLIDTRNQNITNEIDEGQLIIVSPQNNEGPHTRTRGILPNTHFLYMRRFIEIKKAFIE